MRIALVTDAWAPQINGVVRTLQTVCGHVTAQGHTVLVVQPGLFPNLPCPTYPEIRLALTGPAQVAKLLNDFQPDTIHIATEGPLGWLARYWCLKHDFPFTTGYHTRFPEYLQARFGLPLGLGYAALRRFHAPAAAVLVPTASMAEALKTRGFHRVNVWGRGVDTELFQPRVSTAPAPWPRPILLNVGRVSVEKNLEAFINLPVPGTKVVVGDGPQLASLQARYPKVVFTGAKQGAELTALYNQADVFVFPSRTDTFGLVLLEALACGVPVAAYPVTGPLDVLTDPRVAALDEDLGAAVTRALTLSRQACRQFALKHSWAQIAAHLLQQLVPLHR
ncbi:MAG: glycosyltransferase family 1 protein [Alphaproteobacteria bacterium]|nr:glycosyltransferase family 1 protein [Alphaproteobacteria bacterium]